MTRSRLVRFVVSACTLTFTGAGIAAATLPAHATDMVPGTRYGKVVLPTVAAAHARHAASTASGTGALRYGGGVGGVGVTTGVPRVYLVFYGSQWGSANGTDQYGNTRYSGDPKGVAPVLQQLFKGIGTSGETWSDVMTQYCEQVAAGTTTCPSTAPHVGYPTGGAFAGLWVDTMTLSPSRASEHQLAMEADAAASHFHGLGSVDDRSAQYVIVSPSGTHPDGFNTFTANWCAWHDYNNDSLLSGGPAPSTYGNIAFTNLPYLPDAGASCGANYVNSGSAGALDGVSIVAGHEYAETITDQFPAGGWTDSSGEENADKCAWIGKGGSGGAQNVALGQTSLAMQATFSNNDNACEISGGGGGASDAVSVTTPATQTSTAGTAITPVQLQASSTVGDSIASWSASNLPPGLSLNSSGGTATVSGTPTTAGTYSVTVSATDTAGTTGSSAFTWNVNSAPTSGCSSTQVLANGGFENGSNAAPWTVTSGVINNSASEPAHSGAWDAWLDGYGVSHTDTLSQQVTLPAGCSTATLSFWLHVDTAETTTTTAYDKLTVQAVSGTTTATLHTYSNLDKGSGYQLRTLSLPASFAGKTVTLRFTGREDSSLQTSFVIDDVALTAS